MGRIKQGLDYFPLSTDFMHDRIVRRVMKREGDSAFTVLIYIMSYLYSGEGYYVRADTDFCDELSDQLFSTDNDTVRRVIRLFLEYGLFDSALYERYSILTSEDVQRQYLFITKRRSRHHICPDYCLLPEEKTTDEQPDTVAATGENVAVSPNIATASRDTATKTALIKRKEKKENILPNPPFAKGGDEEEEGREGEKVAEGAGGERRMRSAICHEETESDAGRYRPDAGSPGRMSPQFFRSAGESPSLSCSSC